MPEISILLPTYNGARFLTEQLNSILAQSFADFELIAIDDGSTDDSPTILDKCAATDPRVRVLPSDGNRGQKTRLRELLGEAKAPLIAIADQDDIWDSAKLELLYSAIGNHALAFGPSHLIDGAGNSLGKTLMQVVKIDHNHNDKLSILCSSRVSAHAMICRKDLIDASLFESRRPFDWLISLIAAFADEVLFVEQAKTFHRLHGDNAHNGGLLKMLRPWTISLRDIKLRVERFRQKRTHLIEQLDQLGIAEALDPSIRTVFKQSAAFCREAWGEDAAAQSLKPRQVYIQLRDYLKPLAGSQRDWDHFERHLWPMCLGIPRNFAWMMPKPA